MKQAIFFLFLSFIFFQSCETENYIFKKKQSVSSKGWNYQDSLVYTFSVQDTSKIYSLILDIGHTTDFPYQNLYIKTSTLFPEGRLMHQKISSNLADKLGVWHGDCSGTSCLLSLNLQEKTKFQEPGEYRIAIEQFSRDSSLVGINSITLKLGDYLQLAEK